VVNATSRPLYSLEGATVPLIKEASWDPDLVSMGVEKREYFASNGI
jgi:hypothetical protein